MLDDIKKGFGVAVGVGAVIVVIGALNAGAGAFSAWNAKRKAKAA